MRIAKIVVVLTMIFSLKIPIAKSKQLISYQSDMMLLGSCFSENIGSKFSYFKLNASVNPFGIIFNVVSIEKLIQRAVNKDFFTEKDIFFHNDLWHCFEVHSELSNPNKDTFLETLNTLIESTNCQISKLTHCIITLGTSWVYQNNTTGEIVANCHKVPQKEFTKVLLSPAQNEQSLRSIVALIHSVNLTCQFIFTISPVRHSKDGFFENNVSKANLFSALHSSIIHHPSLTYFPSYEIVLDELRDYRFYEKDMLHPNALAVDYIWERFSETYFDQETLSIMQDVEVIQKGLAHRPFNPDTESHRKFLDKLEDKMQVLQKKVPTIDFS